MRDHTLSLIDPERARQFAAAGRRTLFRSWEAVTGADGLAWAVARHGDLAFAVTWLGPGWVFDPAARDARADAFLAVAHAQKRLGVYTPLGI